MINIVKILSSRVNAGKRLVKFLRMGTDDIQENYTSAPYGVDSHPIKNMTAVYAQTGVKGESVIIGYINKNQVAEIGELRLFSTDSDGNIQATVFFRNDGNLEVNGNSDNMVRYSELKAGFDQLKADFNSFVTTYNTHVHPSPAGGSTGVTPSSGSASSADIAASKIDNVKTN